MQCVAVCCSVLQCVAVCCTILQCVAVCCSVLHNIAVCCSVLQCVAVCDKRQNSSYPSHADKHALSHVVYGSEVLLVFNVESCSSSVLQRVAVCCSVLQCVALMSHNQWIPGATGAQSRVLSLQCRVLSMQSRVLSLKCVAAFAECCTHVTQSMGPRHCWCPL